MRVGLDIDNVVSNFDKSILEEFSKEDKNKRNKGIINKNARQIWDGMFDWSKKEVEEFFCNNMEEIAKTLEPRDGAKYYINKMINDGHEVYLISHRVYPHYNHPLEVTEKWLKDNNIRYTKLVLSKSTNKSFECLEHKIDIMFDDSVNNCRKMIDGGINCYLMKTKYNKTPSGDLKYVSSWSELYNKVCDLAATKLERIHTILDTDADNEADDLFALTYLLKSQNRFILDAVTIAPYYHENGISIKEGIEESYKVCKDIFNLSDIDSSNMIFKGSTDYLKNGYLEENDAIKKMVDIITKNKITYIIAVGAITNIAVLLKLHPEIKNKIKIIWLGGHSLMNCDNREYNFKQDVLAVEFVFNSGVDITVIPCDGVASNLTTSIYELKHHLDNNDKLNKYICDRFYNDGKHGIMDRRVIWDISAIAYLINPYWFDIKSVSLPIINEDLSYVFTNCSNTINFAIKLNQDSIYKDFFNKMKKDKH